MYITSIYKLKRVKQVFNLKSTHEKLLIKRKEIYMPDNNLDIKKNVIFRYKYKNSKIY